MKALKVLKVTTIIQAVHAVLIATSAVSVLLYAAYNIEWLLPVAFVLLFYSVYFPVPLPCLFVNLSCLFSARRNPEEKERLGSRWLIVPVMFVGSILLFLIVVWAFAVAPEIRGTKW